MKLFVSALEYSANVHLKYLLRELALRENIELCGIFDESILDSAESQNLGGKSLSLRDSAKQNRGNPKDLRALRSNQPPIEKTQKLQGGLPRFAKGKSRNDEILDSSLRKCSAQNDKNSVRVAESNKKIKLKKPIKSFCYFWLLPKVESPLLLNSNLPNNADSALDSANQTKIAESSTFSIRGKSICNIENIAVMGFIDVLKKAKFFLDLRPKCLNLALSADKVLLMDSSSFNIPLAKRIKKSDKNKQIIYYILPQVWAWKPWRAKAIEANCDKLAAILPFEVERYEKKAEFVGHPLLDEIQYFREINSLANSSLELHSAESSLDSAKSQNLIKNTPSLRADSQNLRGNPPIKKTQDLQGGLPRSHSLARNDKILDSSLRLRSTQNDKIEENAESSDKIKLKKPLKSFCYFWLLPNEESPLSFNYNLPNKVDSQNLKGGLPRSRTLARNDDSFLDSSLRKCSAQNDNLRQSAESSNIFSFMPGSRFAEIKRIFPIFLQVKDALKARDKSARFHLIIPQKFASQNLGQIYGDLSDFHISFDAHRSLFQSRFAFICSGTATLECALIGTPFVLGYKCRAFEAFIARCFLKIKFIGLANILYEKISPNEMFHTELIQGDLSARNLLNALDSADKSEFLRKSLALRKYLKNGASKAVAKMLYDL